MPISRQIFNRSSKSFTGHLKTPGIEGTSVGVASSDIKTGQHKNQRAEDGFLLLRIVLLN